MKNYNTKNQNGTYKFYAFAIIALLFSFGGLTSIQAQTQFSELTKVNPKRDRFGRIPRVFGKAKSEIHPRRRCRVHSADGQ